jgi:hypothetical protein
VSGREILADVTEHLEHYAGPGRDGHVFLGPRGGRLRLRGGDDHVGALFVAELVDAVRTASMQHPAALRERVCRCTDG